MQNRIRDVNGSAHNFLNKEFQQQQEQTPPRHLSPALTESALPLNEKTAIEFNCTGGVNSYFSTGFNRRIRILIYDILFIVLVGGSSPNRR